MSRESDLQCVDFTATEAQISALKTEGYSIIRYTGKAILREERWYEARVTDKNQFKQRLEQVRKQSEAKTPQS